MKIKIILFNIFVFFFFSFTYSQEVIIKGNAKTYKGKTLFIHKSKDFITHTDTILSSFTFDSLGFFTDTLNLSDITLVYIPSERNKFYILLEPNSEYKIIFPKFSKKTKEEKFNPFFKPNELYLGIKNASQKSLNYLINEFDFEYDEYLKNHFADIVNNDKNAMEKNIEVLDRKYKSSKKFFIDYKKFKFAFLRNLLHENNTDFITKKYYSNSEILYNNTAYTNLFLQIYTNYFTFFSKTTDGYRLNYAIQSGNYYGINKIFYKKKHLVKNSNLRELIILKSLHDAFYDKRYNKSALIAILNDFKKETENEKNLEIANNILKKTTILMENYKAPDFELLDRDGYPITLSQFKGKFVYLNFATSWSYTCRQDFRLLQKLQKKYWQFLEVVTIVADDNFEKMTELIADEEFKWTLVDYKNQMDILKTYNIRTYPTYYLIDTDGTLLMSPAPSPNKDFERHFVNILIKKNANIDKILDEK